MMIFKERLLFEKNSSALSEYTYRYIIIFCVKCLVIINNYNNDDLHKKSKVKS